MDRLKTRIKNILVKACKRVGETSPILLDFSTICDTRNASALLDTMRTSKFLDPKEAAIPQNQSILIIAPHPDDEVIGMGGTLVKMKENGCNISVLYLTFGADEQTRIEAAKSAQFIGYDCDYFDFLPKNIPCDTKIFEQIARIINTQKPQTIFIPFLLDDHDDHRRASELLLEVFDQKLVQDFASMDIWAYQVYTTLPLNAVVNITDVLDKKLKAIRCYQSRFRQRDWAHFSKGLNALNVRYLHGNTGEDYAEVFLKTSLPNYLKMCRAYFRNNKGKCYALDEYNKAAR